MTTAVATPSVPEQSAKTRNTVAVWFEIPATNFPRAIRFYENIFATRLIQDSRFKGMAIFPYERPGISGTIMDAPDRASLNGPVIYLNCDNQLDQVLERAIVAGAEIIEPKEALPAGMGWTAQIRDSEGNRVGLHAVV
jgi:predicted enzyme related to lactoylglutathione lyase